MDTSCNNYQNGFLCRLPDVPEGYTAEKNWDFDKLGREKQIEPFEKLLLQITNQPYVVTLDSPWGTGKSLLLRMWHDSLRTRGHACLLFNAWETDFASDPFIAFSEEISSQLRKLDVEPKVKRSVAQMSGTLRKRGTELLKLGFRVAGRVADKYVPGIDSVLQALEEKGLSGEDAADVLDVLTASADSWSHLDNYQQQYKHLQKYREQLQKIADRLTKAGAGPLIIFIDELDRCRPDYAIKMLERVKHIFGVRGVVFVLATDKKQLLSSIAHVYGLEENNSDVYLRRFFDMEISLPDPAMDDFIGMLHERIGISYEYESELIELLKGLVKFYKLKGLRDMGQIFCRLHAITKVYTSPSFGTIALVATFLILQHANRVAFEKINFDLGALMRGRADAVGLGLPTFEISEKSPTKRVISAVLAHAGYHGGADGDAKSLSRKPNRSKDDEERLEMLKDSAKYKPDMNQVREILSFSSQLEISL